MSTRSRPSIASSARSRYSARSRPACSTSESRTARQRSTLIADVVAVELRVLREELAVDVGDLAHEAREHCTVGRTGARSADGVGRAAAAASTRSRTSGSASSAQATPTSSSSSDSSTAGSKPGTRAPSIVSQPSTSRASGPACRSSLREASTPSSETRPWVGLCPTRPQHAAGIRIEPAESVPSAASASPALASAPPSLRSSRRRRGPGSAGSARLRSAGSRTSCRTRTRAGSSCRRSRSPRLRAAAPRPRSAPARDRRRSPSRRSSRARRCRRDP